MVLYSLPDIVGTGAKVALSATSQPCKYWQITATSVASQARVGGIEVSSTRGIPIGPGFNSGQFATPIAEASSRYDLADQYVYLAEGDVVSVAYAV